VPWASLGQGLIVSRLQAEITRAVRPALLAVLGAVLLVLAIACVNVTNLLLARGAQRRGEFAMRAALGAGRSRLTRQVLTESLLLALIGGALGMLVAEAGVRGLVALSPPGLPRVGAVRVDASVFAFGLVITTVIGILVGAIPALHASRAGLQAGVRQSSRGAAGGHRRTRGALVVAEVALALVLLVGAGLLLRSLQRVFAVDAGFDASHVLTMQVQLAGGRLNNDQARYRFFTQVIDEIGRVPGADIVALTSQLPLSGDLDGYGVHLEQERELKDVSSALRYAVTPRYLEAMRIPLHRGRRLDTGDVAGAPRVALINQSFATRAFRDRDPLGQRLRVGPDEGQPYTIVGVVGDVKQTSLSLGDGDAIYVAIPQWHWVDNRMSVVVRARADAAALAPAVRQAIWSIDRNQAIVRVATMDSLLSRSEADRRFALILFEAFGLAALVLAAVGIYGVLSYSVSRRTREMGIRLALGATPRSVRSMIVRAGGRLVAAGIALGCAGAFAATRFLRSLLFEVSATEPLVFAGATAMLAVVALLASWVPAHAATKIDPLDAVRS
jgi:predicted permease